jgi:predicted metalloprotease
VVLLIVAPTVSALISRLSVSQSAYSSGNNEPAWPQQTAIVASSSTAGPVSPTGPAPAGTPDLHPDNPPQPQTQAEVQQALTQNTIYQQSIIPTNCQIVSIDLTSSSHDQIESHMNAFVDCLMATWTPVIIQAGFQLPHPSVTVYSQEVNSPCGILPMENAVYCAADQQIYFAADLVDAMPAAMRALRYMTEAVIAHEFGHTIQYRTMILTSNSVMENQAASQAEKMGWGRRLEMQADCLAGVFFNSVSVSSNMTTADRDNILALFTSLGGVQSFSDDHGTGANRSSWVAAGLNSAAVGTCSTFTAPDAQVG